MNIKSRNGQPQIVVMQYLIQSLTTAISCLLIFSVAKAQESREYLVETRQLICVIGRLEKYVAVERPFYIINLRNCGADKFSSGIFDGIQNSALPNFRIKGESASIQNILVMNRKQLSCLAEILNTLDLGKELVSIPRQPVCN